MSEALCQKVSNITNKYILDNPVEWKNFCKQQKMTRSNLRTRWAEVNGVEGLVIREILQIPETLFTLLKLGLTKTEYMEYSEEKFKLWFADKFPDTKSERGKR